MTHSHSTLSIGKIVLFLALILSGTILPAWGETYNFAHLGIDEGLSASHVKALLRTADGFVWIGTSNGLNRYDGANVKHYLCFDKEKNRGNNNIGDLYEDSQGIIWIGTDRGVYCYIPAKDRIEYSDGFDKIAGDLNWVQSIDGDTKGNISELRPP